MLHELRLDEETWAMGSALRKAEWRAAIEDLLDAGTFGPTMARRHVLLTSREGAFLFEALDDDGEITATGSLAVAAIAEFVEEYTQIIRRLDEGAAFRDESWLHAMDMAKKVVHDKAAEKIAKELPMLSDDHPTLRRVFTLLFALTVDTTTMLHARHHRS